MEESHSNIDYYTGLSDLEIPTFISLILTNKKYSDDIKKQLVNKLMYRYLEDEELRNTLEGCKIIFLDNKYFGIYENVRTAPIPENYPGWKIRCFTISKNRTAGYLMVHQVIVNIGREEQPNLARVNTLIHIDEENYIEDEKLIDTGASYTTIPFPEKWNIETGTYKIKNSGRRFNPLELLNDNIESVENLRLKTSDGESCHSIVEWKIPIKFSIGGLQPVEIKRMTAPLTEEQTQTNVLGFDILSKHTLIMSSRDMCFNIQIMSSERSEIEPISISSPIKKFKKIVSGLGIFSSECEIDV